MSRVGVVSDIHANLPAFEAVLEELQGQVDYIVCLGDIIGICGFPAEVIETVQNECLYTIKGNHDILPFTGEVESEVLTVEKELFFNETTEEQQSWLYKLETRLCVEDDELLLAHSYPFENQSAGVRDGNSGVFPREMVSVGSEFSSKILLLGHTHEQHSVNLEKFGHSVLVVNPGSVGGYYQDVAEFAVVDTESREVDLKSVEYDKSRVTEKVKQLETEFTVDLLG